MDEWQLVTFGTEDIGTWPHGRFVAPVAGRYRFNSGAPEQFRLMSGEETTVDDLVAFLKARLAEDEQWAYAASHPYFHTDPPAEVSPAGVHWVWADGESYEPLTVNPVLYRFVGGDSNWNVTLRSVETWPSKTDGRPMPKTVAGTIEEMESGPGGHIVRHDPARVLAEVEAKRRIVDVCAEPDDNGYDVAMMVLPLLALPYADHPDWRPEWAPDPAQTA